MKLVIGLGNPGIQYQNTRHNIGFKIIDEMLASTPEQLKVSVPELIGELHKLKTTYLVFKPTSFMNNSGVEVQKVVSYFKIPLSDVLVVHDEVDLLLGDIRLELGRSSAGHRGVESIISHMGSKDFYRLRVGVNRPPANIPTDQYVLQEFSEEDKTQLDKIITEAVNQIHDWL